MMIIAKAHTKDRILGIMAGLVTGLPLLWFDVFVAITAGVCVGFLVTLRMLLTAVLKVSESDTDG
ncbi:MAG: hypothetical protein OEY52_17115 [Gammaproteobacteria bacterium]|nr:hypothetical protein [Gammaproteobacteria bacterium]